jgi:thymidine phosphorylase
MHRRPVLAEKPGRVSSIDNRRVAMVAKLAGAPSAKAAGVELHMRLGSEIDPGQPLYTVHAETPGELAYVLDYVEANADIIGLSES